MAYTATYFWLFFTWALVLKRRQLRCSYSIENASLIGNVKKKPEEEKEGWDQAQGSEEEEEIEEDMKNEEEKEKEEGDL